MSLRTAALSGVTACFLAAATLAISTPTAQADNGLPAVSANIVSSRGNATVNPVRPIEQAKPDNSKGTGEDKSKSGDKGKKDKKQARPIGCSSSPCPSYCYTCTGPG
ncbi:hypothetical protein ABZ942_28470 [Nocardia sp. NPDC046473]|uniref:hypothetical protein n=1 Tax=Nocardia sp. NPDC046473 TaxID=3155733 RepID=UPI0034071E2C